MKQKTKILFLDRDGTLIDEPENGIIDSLEKLQLISGVIPALLRLKEAGYCFVLVTNQKGIGTEQFSEENFLKPHQAMMGLFESQGITFEAEHICPHLAEVGCECRKPKLGMVKEYLNNKKYDLTDSYVIGDRDTDVELAKQMGVKGIKLGQEGDETWNKVVDHILNLDTSTPELNRIRWACRRGMLELDEILINFFDKRYTALPEEEQKLFKEMLESNDKDLYPWLMGLKTPEEPKMVSLIEQIRAAI